jgi:hypothetical protein
MLGLIDKRNLAGDRYAKAVLEMWDAFADLAALDRLTNSPSFGVPVDTVSMRHPTFLPALSGSITDGVTPAIEKRSREK